MRNTGGNCLIFAAVSRRGYSFARKKTVKRHAMKRKAAKPVRTSWPKIPISTVGAFRARSHEYTAALLPVFTKYASECPYLGYGDLAGD